MPDPRDPVAEAQAARQRMQDRVNALKADPLAAQDPPGPIQQSVGRALAFATSPIEPLKQRVFDARDRVSAAIAPDPSVFDSPVQRLANTARGYLARHAHAAGTAAGEMMPSPVDAATFGAAKGAGLMGALGQLKVLVAMEHSGRVREAFRKLGHEAYSADFLDSDIPSPNHLKGDAFPRMYSPPPTGGKWDCIIGHPSCQFLSSSGQHWSTRKNPDGSFTEDALKRQADTEAAVDDFMRVYNAPAPHVAVENPVGIMSTRFRKPDQYFHPYEFGEDASKKTGLWLKDLPPLVADPRQRYPGRRVGTGVIDLSTGEEKYIERWSNQLDDGQSNLSPSPDRWKIRSVTPQGVANAMAEQWSTYIEDPKEYQRLIKAIREGRR